MGLDPRTGVESSTDNRTTDERTVIHLESGAEPIAGYRLLAPLGRGGGGEVWNAVAPGGFPVALKFISLANKLGTLELHALEIVRHVRNPHLLAMFGSWQVGDRIVIAMELADGTLYDRFSECVSQGLQGIPGPEIHEFFRDAAKGIDFLNGPHHSLDVKEVLGIQHRDIKPKNLLMVGGGVKVADYGLARVLNHAQTGHTGSMTVAYAAPEFFKGVTSDRSDQYCLAVTYCHMRGGSLPFTGQDAEIIAGHVFRSPDLSRLPEREREAVARALSKDPMQRWPSCRAFVDAVAGHEPAVLRDDLPPEDPDDETLGPRRFANPTSVAVFGPDTGRQSALEMPEEFRTAATQPYLTPPNPERKPALSLRPLVDACVLALAVLIACSLLRPRTVVFIPTLPPGFEGYEVVDEVEPIGRRPDRSRLEPLKRLLFVKETKDVRRWPRRIVRTEGGVLFDSVREGIYLPEGYAPDEHGGDVRGWPRRIVRTADNARFVLIEGGDFSMGDFTQPARGPDENHPDRPAHPVRVSAFYLQQTEVTYGETHRFFAARATRPEERWLDVWDLLKKDGTPEQIAAANRHPAVGLSNVVAREFARWAGGRLTREDEWEYAARSLGKEAAYVWNGRGDFRPPSDQLCYVDRLGTFQSPLSGRVMNYKDDRTEQGIHDMAGNVREWCLTEWRPFPGAPAAARRAASRPTYVIRGGSFLSGLKKTRTTYRSDHEHELFTDIDLGFRVAIDCPTLSRLGTGRERFDLGRAPAEVPARTSGARP